MPRPETAWQQHALRVLDAEEARAGDTHLRVFPLPSHWGIALYLKDESGHPTGSLKHRLARALFRAAIVEGSIGPGTTVVEASSGSTAVSEAYFASLLGTEFVSVMPETTSVAKRELIERFGGRCALVSNPAEIYSVAEDLGAKCGWHYLDQFGRAATVYDWHGKDAIAAVILRQMAMEPFPIPDWMVVGAGTGGTSAALGRYLRAHRLPTKLAVVDPEGSVFTEAWKTRRRDIRARGSRIEGIGRPRVEPSFLPEVIDVMIQVPDAASIAAVELLYERTGISAGGSTGTNLAGALAMVRTMRSTGRHGSVVSLVCDSGDRYRDTVHSQSWRREQDVLPDEALGRMRRFLAEDADDELF